MQTCVEVKRTSDAVYVRDSKELGREGYTVLSASPSQWREFLEKVSSSPDAGSTAAFDFRSEANGDVVLRGSEGALVYDADEWSTFLVGVREGDFGLDLVTLVS